MERYAVIMAGGYGTRFWPLSRRRKPKQLLNISGRDIMINETIRRVKDIVPPGNILAVTNHKHRDIIQKLVTGELPSCNIFFEPAERNTAACIAYAAIAINSRCSDAVMCVLPSDHYISDEEEFERVLERGFEAAEETAKLITIGIRPSFPATGYGYIQYRKEAIAKDDIHEVLSFVEKPGLEKALEYLKRGDYLWNSGIFLWRTETIMENMERYLPRVYKKMIGVRDCLGTDKEWEGLVNAYEGIQNISIDYGVLERSDDVLVLPGSFGWSDVGSWDALGAVIAADEQGNIVKARHVGTSTQNSIIYSEDRLIATIGVEGLIIADSGDALLICPRNRANEVKDIVQLIRDRNLEEYL